MEEKMKLVLLGFIWIILLDLMS